MLGGGRGLQSRAAKLKNACDGTKVAVKLPVHVPSRLSDSTFSGLNASEIALTSVAQPGSTVIPDFGAGAEPAAMSSKSTSAGATGAAAAGGAPTATAASVATSR